MSLHCSHHGVVVTSGGLLRDASERAMHALDKEPA